MRCHIRNQNSSWKSNPKPVEYALLEEYEGLSSINKGWFLYMDSPEDFLKLLRDCNNSISLHEPIGNYDLLIEVMDVY